MSSGHCDNVFDVTGSFLADAYFLERDQSCIQIYMDVDENGNLGDDENSAQFGG